APGRSRQRGPSPPRGHVCHVSALGTPFARRSAGARGGATCRSPSTATAGGHDPAPHGVAAPPPRVKAYTPRPTPVHRSRGTGTKPTCPPVPTCDDVVGRGPGPCSRRSTPRTTCPHPETDRAF